jgi:peptidoglycan L-alanyl-D-glutamate endopeptidase CwlK
MGNSLGTTSKKVYDTLHPDLQLVVDWVLKYCVVDLTLYEGHRKPEKQFEYYKKGREFKNGRWVVVNQKAVITNADGYHKLSNHNYNPSHALDFKAYVKDKPQLEWDVPHLTYIAASFVMAAEFLYLQGKITHKIRWGGNWDKDGDLADNKLYDRPHVEIYKP